MSRSKMAEDEEFLDVKKDENCTSERGYIEIKEEKNFIRTKVDLIHQGFCPIQEMGRTQSVKAPLL